MNFNPVRSLKDIGFRSSPFYLSVTDWIKRSTSSPLCFIALQILISSIYFAELLYWWPIVLILQIALCITGFAIPSWRITAFAVLAILILSNLNWLQPVADLSKQCPSGIDLISGTVKTDSFRNQSYVDLIECTVWCQNSSVFKPIARLSGLTPGRRKWLRYRPGDRLELKGVTPIEEDFFSVHLSPLPRFKVFNLSYQQKVLNRSRFLLYLQAKARYYLSGFPLLVFKSLLTADRTDLTANWKRIFKELGVFHVFAISGMHIGILFLWLTFVFRRLLAFHTKWILKGMAIVGSDLISVILILLFLRTIGMPISGVRAVMMLSWWLFVKHLLPWHPLWFILLGTALLILLFEPVVLGQISFQLSFLSVAGIIAILPVLPIGRRTESLIKRTGKTLLSSMIISGWLLVFTLPITGELSEVHSLLAPVNNLIHIGFISMIVLPLLLLLLVHVLASYYLGMGLGEFLLFAFVNLVIKLWEQLLMLNHKLNSYFLISSPALIELIPPLLYWLLLLMIASLIKAWISAASR